MNEGKRTFRAYFPFGNHFDKWHSNLPLYEQIAFLGAAQIVLGSIGIDI